MLEVPGYWKTATSLVPKGSWAADIQSLLGKDLYCHLEEVLQEMSQEQELELRSRGFLAANENFMSYAKAYCPPSLPTTFFAALPLKLPLFSPLEHQSGVPLLDERLHMDGWMDVSQFVSPASSSACTLTKLLAYFHC